MDKITLARIELLHPRLREEARQIYTEASGLLTGGAGLRFTHTLRTFEEQAQIYAQGRNSPGRIVTNARPGFSFHNYGLAVDICLISRDKKQVYWDTLKDYDGDGVADWMEVVAVFESYGWQWGGRWKFKDPPHFQKSLGYSIKTLLAKHQAERKTYLNLA